ncbi:sigma-70 family RNA polymerase sigma factor [Actinorugispora endophytica]|uniref:RNA polymerase sigma-70 factor (ECF subfamily) n=1 Tax=Actinorugispora endophytica TaxID=1605990 RepID=A0A4V3D719_9ACTN|nr:sigma-70 family RNA polymerase sigma factor [Actinorugispora endophytica]TDQ46147.1 RNA polymerase sigma-70 factor (ECF subfamily) [Actinorugispora endophytica]
MPNMDFEAVRPQLTAVAFRLLGSVHDAEDAVQNTWLKASAADTGNLRNPAAWLTTVLTRVCLDELRKRHRRHEEPLLADMLPAESIAADERYLQQEDVSRALMVVLDRLTPAQRAAYVLHDLFDVPFREVAETLRTSVENAKKHASRARRRLEQAEPAPSVTTADHAVVEAFLAAAAGGDVNRMIALMTDDCVRTADAALLPPGVPKVVTGAHAVATETSLFVDRIRASAPMLIGSRPVNVIAPGGHLLAVITITTRDRRIARIDISRRRVHGAVRGVGTGTSR